ncbi:UNVERIFIED_CONTAM: hypothetical protein HDU68_001180 [Siphonaria sp. JEL0065]|nr:hypothetical protein HDU68_001180 [Siphonaria sp. JEL0065]
MTTSAKDAGDGKYAIVGRMRRPGSSCLTVSPGMRMSENHLIFDDDYNGELGGGGGGGDYGGDLIGEGGISVRDGLYANGGGSYNTESSGLYTDGFYGGGEDGLAYEHERQSSLVGGGCGAGPTLDIVSVFGGMEVTTTGGNKNDCHGGEAERSTENLQSVEADDDDDDDDEGLEMDWNLDYGRLPQTQQPDQEKSSSLTLWEGAVSQYEAGTSGALNSGNGPETKDKIEVDQQMEMDDWFLEGGDESESWF